MTAVLNLFCRSHPYFVNRSSCCQKTGRYKQFTLPLSKEALFVISFTFCLQVFIVRSTEASFVVDEPVSIIMLGDTKQRPQSLDGLLQRISFFASEAFENARHHETIYAGNRTSKCPAKNCWWVLFQIDSFLTHSSKSKAVLFSLLIWAKTPCVKMVHRSFVIMGQNCSVYCAEKTWTQKRM